MAPIRPVRNIKVHVSRHNSQRIGPALTAQVELLAKQQSIRTDIRQPTNEPSSTIAQAIESASDWNSMLLTARADRGPQWDVGTQQFLVEKETDLYYDPTPIRGYLKDEKVEAAKAEAASQPMSTPRISHRGPPNGSGVPLQYGVNGVNMVSATPPRHAMQGNMGPPFSGSPYATIPPGQFYGERGTPMMTRGMSMEGRR
ncbi:hypothetical protein K488DRAFT_91237 [Vararia minispora EC-137]|uniref:Uncharacterized protein n=1 Tax=Vararia minispora EC-137 TaxID=1314806 RepID=A0ACB8Q5X2_9AGAM|nr:hypothetical protein K488DRAFT_91237 [Vararia minispora EC-137]